METHIIEATNGPQNWGKFLIGAFTEEWQRLPATPGQTYPASLLIQRGWTNKHRLVLDLETGEGAIFKHGGYARADLDKHRIWVCPLFEPFLAWLYTQDLTDITKLPEHVDLPDAPFQWQGYRRSGPQLRALGRAIHDEAVDPRMGEPLLHAILRRPGGERPHRVRRVHGDGGEHSEGHRRPNMRLTSRSRYGHKKPNHPNCGRLSHRIDGLRY